MGKIKQFLHRNLLPFSAGFLAATLYYSLPKIMSKSPPPIQEYETLEYRIYGPVLERQPRSRYRPFNSSWSYLSHKLDESPARTEVIIAEPGHEEGIFDLRYRINIDEDFPRVQKSCIIENIPFAEHNMPASWRTKHKPVKKYITLFDYDCDNGADVIFFWSQEEPNSYKRFPIFRENADHSTSSFFEWVDQQLFQYRRKCSIDNIVSRVLSEKKKPVRSF